MVVTRLFLLSEQSFFPSKVTEAFLLTKKTERSIIEELKMKGKIEINKSTFKSEITAKDAILIPIAKEPVLPTKILPLTLK